MVAVMLLCKSGKEEQSKICRVTGTCRQARSVSETNHLAILLVREYGKESIRLILPCSRSEMIEDVYQMVIVHEVELCVMEL